MQDALRDKVYSRQSWCPFKTGDLVIPIKPYPHAFCNHGVQYADSMDKLLGRVLQTTQADDSDATCRADGWWWSNNWLLTVEEYQEFEAEINSLSKFTESDAKDILNLL